jgi:hypothetical protein
LKWWVRLNMKNSDVSHYAEISVYDV